MSSQMQFSNSRMQQMPSVSKRSCSIMSTTPSSISSDQRRDRDGDAVDKVRICHDRTGNTLTVWFDDPAKEVVCEEVDDDVVLMKDRRGDRKSTRLNSSHV